MKRRRMLGKLLIICGIAAVGLGVIGIVVPLLPTTPFLLLAAACFMRSSERLYAWFIHNRWFGDYVNDYREQHGMTARAKVCALTLLWSVIGYSAFGVIDSWWVRGILGVVALGVTIHLLCLRTITHDKHNGGRSASCGREQIGEGETTEGRMSA